MKRISFIAISGVLFFTAAIASAATSFQGPSSQPTSGNVPGVIWNVDGTSVSQPNAVINVGQVGKTQQLLGDVKLSNTAAFKVDSVGAGPTSFNIGNWGSGQQPFTFGVYGDIKMYSFGGSAGQKGRMDAVEYCINGASCITTWPSGGGGTLTGITAGTGASVTGGAPSPTINVTDLYVNTSGDTMTGALTMNWPGYRALTVNGGNGGSGAVYGNNTTANGYGGEFYGAYGVYATTPNSASGYYAGYFDGYSGGINAIGRKAAGVGVLGQNSGAGSYGVEGYATAGYGGLFMDSTYWSYVGGQGYGIYTNGLLYTTGGGYIGGALTVNNGDLTINNNRNLCLGGVCKNAWPASGGGTISSITNGGGLTVTNGSGPATTLAVIDNYVNTTGDTMSGALTVNANVAANSLSVSGGNISLAGTNNWGIKNYSSAVKILSMPSVGTNYWYFSNYDSSGNFVSDSAFVNNLGQIQTYGTSNGYYFKDRSTALNWAQYSYADEARLWNSTYGDVYRFHNNGVFFAANDITTNNNIYTTLGNIGAQVTSPAYPLDVAGTANLNSGIASGVALRVNGAEALWYNGTYFSYGYGGSANYFADNVGINTTAPGQRLDINLGYGRVSSGYSWLTNSDVRYKKNIATLENTLDKVSRLRGVRFDLKEDNQCVTGKPKHIGFIAQELEKEYPELVITDDKGYKSVAYDKMTAVLTQATKELKEENDKLKTQNESLEWRLRALEAKVDSLMK